MNQNLVENNLRNEIQVQDTVDDQENPDELIDSANKFSLGTLISQITSKGRDVVMSYTFGTNPSLSALTVVLSLVSAIRRFLGKGIVHYIFVPQFEAFRKENPERAFRFFRDLVSTLTALLLSFVLLVEIGIWGWLNYSDLFQEFKDKYREVIYLSAVILPSTVFVCLFGLNSALLSCEKKFFVMTLAPVGFNLVWIVAMLLVSKMPLDIAIERLAITVAFATFTQWLMTAPGIIRLLKSSMAQKWWQGVQYFSKDLSNLAKPLLYGTLGVGTIQLNNIIDNFFAMKSDPCGPSYLHYSIKMYQIPFDLFSIALSVVLLPSLSRALLRNDKNGYQKLLESFLKRGVYFMLPASIALIVLGTTAVNLMYHHGKFSDLSVYETTRCLAAYALGLLPQTLVLMLVPACYACNEYRFPLIAASISLALNIGLNWLFTCYFGWKAVSVAASTSLCILLNCILLARMLEKKLAIEIITPSFKSYVKKIVLCGIAAGVITAFLGQFIVGDHTLRVFFSNILPTFPTNLYRRIYDASFLGCCFLGIWYILQKIFGIKNYQKRRAT